MALAKLPIKIRIKGNEIVEADIPMSQEDLMQGWLKENKRPTAASGYLLARQIDIYYPGGFEAWGKDANYPVDIQR